MLDYNKVVNVSLTLSDLLTVCDILYTRSKALREEGYNCTAEEILRIKKIFSSVFDEVLAEDL